MPNGPPFQPPATCVDPVANALSETRVNADLAIVVLLYTLAAYRPRPVSIAGLAVCLLGSAVAIARCTGGSR